MTPSTWNQPAAARARKLAAEERRTLAYLLDNLAGIGSRPDALMLCDRIAALIAAGETADDVGRRLNLPAAPQQSLAWGDA